MKPKQMIQLVVAVVILFAAGIVIYLQVAPKNQDQDKGLTYEVITLIEPDYNSQAIDKLKDANEAKNFYTKPDLKTGVGNPSPFGGL